MTDMSTSELLRLQARVIGALILRETRATFGTSQIGYLWAIITPAASIIFLVFIFSLAGRQPPFGSSPAAFFAIGILTLEFFNKLSNTLMGTFKANRTLLTYPPIKETDALFARMILVTATYMLIMGLFFGGLILVGFADPPAFPAQILFAFATTALFGFGFGTLSAIIISMWDSWASIEKILTRPLFFVSAIFYIPSMLPPEARNVLQWNPILQLIEWMRVGYYPNYNSVVLDRGYVMALSMVLIFLGLAGERLYRKQRSGA